jgi:hypothetical protein
MYMTFEKAKRLAQENYSTYTDIGKLQSKRVLILDAIRRADSYEAERNGLLKDAVEGGFFKSALTHCTSGIMPRDMWLAHNLKTSLQEADARFKQLTNCSF